MMKNTPYLDYSGLGYITVHTFQTVYHSVHLTSVTYTSIEMNAHVNSETYTEKYLADIGVYWRHTKCPSTGEWTHSGTALPWKTTQQKEMNYGLVQRAWDISQNNHAEWKNPDTKRASSL